MPFSLTDFDAHLRAVNRRRLRDAGFLVQQPPDELDFILSNTVSSSSDPADFDPLAIVPLSSSRPLFRDQVVIDTPGRYDLPFQPGCSLVLIHSVLDEAALSTYLQDASRIPRTSGRSAYGAMKPRREICYFSPGDPPYRYSGVTHCSRGYPEHVLRASTIFLNLFEAMVPENRFRRLSYGVDIIYSNEFERGGSISAHSDNELPGWGLVLVFSLGQTRWMRVRHNETRQWFNVAMKHNSLLAMYGKDFQSSFTHQVDKLQRSDTVGARLSLNLRYGPESEAEMEGQGAQKRDR